MLIIVNDYIGLRKLKKGTYSFLAPPYNFQNAIFLRHKMSYTWHVSVNVLKLPYQVCMANIGPGWASKPVWDVTNHQSRSQARHLKWQLPRARWKHYTFSKKCENCAHPSFSVLQLMHSTAGRSGTSNAGLWLEDWPATSMIWCRAMS